MLFVFIIIVFSSDYHFLWILYDILALSSLFYLMFKVKKFNIIIILSIAFFLLQALFSGSHIISYLSIWDNIKHIFLIYVLYILMAKYKYTRKIEFMRKLGKFLMITFILESILIFYQYYIGYDFDDISGTFGYGASHSIGYFSLLVIGYRLYITKKLNLITFIIIFDAIIINYMSENMGFYILLVLLFSFYRPAALFYLIVISTVVYILFSSFSGNFITSMIGRFLEFFTYSQELDLTNIKSSRGSLTAYALYLGNFFGVGPGAFSSIYGLTGWKIDELANSQINISTVTNLVSEYGIVGFIVWIILYLYIINSFIVEQRVKFSVSIFIIFVFFYNRLLMDERIIFMIMMLILIMNYDSKIIKKGIK